MPTITTPTITTRRRKHFPSQQYTGMLFLTYAILLEYGPYFASPSSELDVPYSVQGRICDSNLQNFMNLGCFVIHGIPLPEFAIWLPCEVLRRKQQTDTCLGNNEHFKACCLFISLFMCWRPCIITAPIIYICMVTGYTSFIIIVSFSPSSSPEP
jgi:hypothetical protein